jgi:O-acetyl-ADP-ribose deacetylase (regulator of RNase III)
MANPVDENYRSGILESKTRDKIHVMLGDITDADTDAIVNAANNELILGAGVAGAIRRKGGPTIQSECDGIGPIRLGEAAITGGGKLKCSHVIHAASMRLGGKATADTLRSAARNAFSRAEEKELVSISLPAVGAGIAGFPVRRCAEILMNEAVLALRRRIIREVRFYLHDQVAYDAFMEAYRALGE